MTVPRFGMDDETAVYVGAFGTAMSFRVRGRADNCREMTTERPAAQLAPAPSCAPRA
jgi:hypothetical protein